MIFLDRYYCFCGLFSEQNSPDLPNLLHIETFLHLSPSLNLSETISVQSLVCAISDGHGLTSGYCADFGVNKDLNII